MPDYDRQLMLLFLTGDPDDDAIEKGADAINRKARNSGLKSNCVSVPIFQHGRTPEYDRRFNEMIEQLGKLTDRSRLYLLGHGDWREQTLGDWPAPNTAGLLGGGRIKNGVKIISILSCSLGADSDAPENVRISNSCNSFASNFHRELGQRHGLYTEVYARIWSMSAFDERAAGRKLADDDDRWGRKLVNPFGSTKMKNNLTESKLHFFWEGHTQKRKWAY